MSTEVKYYEQISWTPGFALAAAGLAELAAENRIQTMCIGWSDECLVATVDGQDAGVLVFEYRKNGYDYHVNMAYVKPEFRRRGVYSALFRGLVERARVKDVRRIVGGVATDNEAMNALAIKLGRVPKFTTYYYEV